MLGWGLDEVRLGLKKLADLEAAAPAAAPEPAPVESASAGVPAAPAPAPLTDVSAGETAAGGPSGGMATAPEEMKPMLEAALDDFDDAQKAKSAPTGQ